MSDHAPLSPSSSERWINCTASAKHNVGSDTSSTYAQQGSEAHLMAEWKVKKALGHKVRDPTNELEYFDEEMEECTDAYCEFVMEQVQKAKQSCSDPQVLVEQRLDFTRWVAESFGTADCIIVADGTMTVIDAVRQDRLCGGQGSRRNAPSAAAPAYQNTSAAGLQGICAGQPRADRRNH